MSKGAWLKGVINRVDEQTTQPAGGVGYGPMPEVQRLKERLEQRTPDEMERVELCEHHAEIIAINARIEWHVSETARLVEERAERQGKVATIIARLGIITK
jgi:hypothetical protein